MHRRLQRAYTTLVEHGSVGYAKIAMTVGFSDLDHIIAKATAPDDVPLPERYVWELTKIFSFSPSSTRAFALSFTRRFGRTRCWRVALKCLALLHRLLRSLPEGGGRAFRANLQWARSNDLISLHPCNFRDASSSASGDFTVFIRSYARLLDETLDCSNHCFTGGDGIPAPPLSESFPEQMKEVGRALELTPQLLSLVDRVMECRPIGAAARSFLVRSAMKQIVRDSFSCYSAIRRDLALVLDNLHRMQYRSCIAGLGLYRNAAIQAGGLGEFYESCMRMGLCGPYEYPAVEKIPLIHVRALESFVAGLWQLTESSSSSSSASWSVASPSTLTPTEEETTDKQPAAVVGVEWEKFDEKEEERPLIQFENDKASWEILLEASTRTTRLSQTLYSPLLYGDTDGRFQRRHQKGDWMEQVQDAYPFNPFYAGYATPYLYGRGTTDNYVCAWGGRS